MIEVRVTEKEFLIAFSYADRDRAKLIRNYRWDPIQKVWRYPLSKHTYQELLREFDSDELEFIGDMSRLTEWNRRAKSDEELEKIAELLSEDPDNDLPGTAEYRLMCSLYEMVNSYGFTVQSDKELFSVLEECVIQRTTEARADTHLAIQNAQLTATLSEFTRLKLEHQNESGNIEAMLVNAAWGSKDIPRPDFLASFNFGSDGVIKATEWVARSLGAILRKPQTARRRWIAVRFDQRGCRCPNHQQGRASPL